MQNANTFKINMMMCYVSDMCMMRMCFNVRMFIPEPLSD